MENQSLLLTLSTGVIASFILFFIFYKLVKLEGKLSGLFTALIVLGIYIPLGAWQWAGLDVFAIHFAFFAMSAYGLAIITSHRDEQRRVDQRMGVATKKQGWFHWAPAIIAIFFLILAVVDSTIITLASKGADKEMMAWLPEPRSGREVSSNFPGAVSTDFQENYLAFNSYLSDLKEQGQRGWKVKDGWSAKPALGQDNHFAIRLVDKDDKAVAGATAKVSFLRPSNEKLDMEYALPETSEGVYGAPIKFSNPGRWMMSIKIQRGDEKHNVQGETWVYDAP